MYTKSILAFVLILLVLAALVIGGLFHWRGRTFRNCEYEFGKTADMLEQVVTEMLKAYSKCAREPDGEQAIRKLMQKNADDGVMWCMEEDYRTIAGLTKRMALLALPWECDRLLVYHHRLILLEQAIAACNYPTFCREPTLWSPGIDGFFFALTAESERRAKEEKAEQRK